MCGFFCRAYGKQLYDEVESLPAANRNISNRYRVNRIVSSDSKQTSGTTNFKRKRTYTGEMVSKSLYPNAKSKRLQDDAEFVLTSDDMKCKQLHHSQTFEEVPAKLPWNTHSDEGSVDDQKLARDETAIVSRGMDEKETQKPKRPAQNLTIGTSFDLMSHLDAARKKTRRDFDPDLVTVVRRPYEGLRLLQTRPEFSGTEAVTTSLLSEDHSDDASLLTEALSLCCGDTDCAVRLGALIARNIEQHVDMKRLEETTKSVSHRLRRGSTKTNEREIVCRKRPILISTVPKSASQTRSEVLQNQVDTDATLKVGLSHYQQPAGHITAKCRQNQLHYSNTDQRLSTSVSSGFRNMPRTSDTNGVHRVNIVDNVPPSMLQYPPVRPFNDVRLKGNPPLSSLRSGIGVNRSVRMHLLHQENLPCYNDNTLPRRDGYVLCISNYD